MMETVAVAMAGTANGGCEGTTCRKEGVPISSPRALGFRWAGFTKRVGGANAGCRAGPAHFKNTMTPMPIMRNRMTQPIIAFITKARVVILCKQRTRSVMLNRRLIRKALARERLGVRTLFRHKRWS